MPIRLAYARINQETNALSPVPTTLDDFRSLHDLEGAELLDATSRRAPEIRGMFRRAELTGFVDGLRKPGGLEPVPLFSTWAIASGALSESTYESLEQRLLESIDRAGKLDGIYLCLHGALGARAVPDPEARWIEKVRNLRPKVPLVVSYDLHGNLTKAKVEGSDALVAYGTNPHRDHVRVGRKCAQILAGLARGRPLPTVAWRSLPMILGGGNTIDFLEPMRPVFSRSRAMEKLPKVLSTSVFMCHPWNDSPNLGWSTAAVTEGDRALAESLADELAEACWARKEKLPPNFVGPSEAIERARKARARRAFGTVVMADASDVVTAGAPGENTALLSALLREGQGLLSYVPLRDPHAVEELWQKGIGDSVVTKVGGRLDPSRGAPLELTAKLISKQELRGFRRIVVLAIEHVRLVITEGPAIAVKPAFYSDVGLSPFRADVCVVKNFFPFLLFFLPYNRKTIFVKTSGVTDFDAAFSIRFDGPVHPRDAVTDWRERDRARRSMG
ncbi:MAG: M81 family metallopeptidase [Deltaproteobacteria bacterium]|nr:M81 family metallopeptidase [Deltaproteobacteria bacterium]